ncbi:activating transcription factor 7-interacting protein 1 isoform X1 [Micropterus salmoides]|uniref:activating transcription factor 7-interacting protein 1 isoform X1 n=1 Tax=Micropterus salmoides TaxID=27706 RepID=UPI0018EB17E0|nr:activating transcription factor 7-interacting protein 1 isoform X1 [Micropterus salmoides]XP_038569547.1 activating transcription factor 7-interacting protein 1 isoform X1 [Micropterus salmoides]XP_038569548.1 activating transcription factor 7-interacting protein 1 isoform X1 [Micropterus salmoides]
MEVVVTEEKKKIFRARKTMKISDRQQLESLHSTLLTAAPGLSDTSPPPLMNGTHKEDGQKVVDKEQNNISDSNSPSATSPASPASLSSPAPFLSLNLSPSPASSQSPKAKDETTSPTSPFHSLNFELKKMEAEEEEEQKGSSSPSSNESVTPASTESKENQEKDTEAIPEMEKKGEEQTTEDLTVDLAKDSVKGSVPCSPVPPLTSDCTDPMDTDNDTTKAKDPEASTAKLKDKKPSSPKSTTSDSSPPCPSSSRPASSSCADQKQEKEIKEEDIKEEENEKEAVKKGSINEEKMEVDSMKVKVETKKEKTEVRKTTKSSRPSSTPPSNTVVQEEKGSTSGLKRTLSEGFEKDGQTTKREGKRPKVEREELEAQLELKITAKAGSHHKLEKIVQQLVDERLRALEQTIFDKHFKELKDRVDKIDCATKHQTAINTLQAKIARLAKKFGEANQASENKRKQETLAAVTAAAAAAATAATAAKTATVANNPQAQRPVWTPMEVKQSPTTVSSSITAVNPALSAPSGPVAAPALTPTSTAMVTQAPILQLITSTSNAVSTLATGITTQSPTGTLLLKTAPGSSMMTTGQPLLIQLPLSMTNGQAGTLVNIPVSSLSAAGSLNKTKTTASTATFILKPAPAITTAPASAPTAATVSALQASTGQISSAQLSLARAVYQGGAGGITTPNAGVSVTTARTPAQSVSVAGAMSSASSPATSGPAATGSTAPGPPQGTSLTSKTDNQATGSTLPKAAAPVARPKGSVIDLTEDDDDVQVTGVKNATVAAPSPTQRPQPIVSIPNSAGARSSPLSNQNSSSNPQLTVHHRPPVDSPMKSRTVTTSMPTRGSSMALPPLPAAPAPPRIPPEAERSSPPQQPQLKLVPSQTGIVLSWCVAETDRNCAAVDSYHLYAFHQDNSNSNAAQQHWKKIGEVKALPLPMACTLTQFQSGSTYHFAVRAKDIYGRFGSFCEPQCTNVISSSSS